MAYCRQYVMGTGNISYTLDPGRPAQLEEVRLHLSAAGGANSFTVTLDSAQGSEYDVVLNTQDMTSATDEIYQPTRPEPLVDGDKLVFAWTNASTKTYGLEIIWQ